METHRIGRINFLNRVKRDPLTGLFIYKITHKKNTEVGHLYSI